jgi:hypothetical protein
MKSILFNDTFWELKNWIFREQHYGNRIKAAKVARVYAKMLKRHNKYWGRWWRWEG